MTDILINNCKVVPAVIPSAGAVNPLTAVVVDGTGFSRAMFIINTGAAAAGAKLNAKIQKSATSGGALADITGAALTEVLAATGASKSYVIDVAIDPAKPFMEVTGAVTVDTFANSVTCVLYNGTGWRPVSAPASEVVKTQ